MTPTTTITTGEAPSPLGNYSQAVKAGPFVYVAGQVASDFKTGLAPETRIEPGFPHYGVPIKLQTDYIMKNIRHVLECANSSFEDVVSSWTFLTDITQTSYASEVRRQYLAEKRASTAVGIKQLAVKDALIEIDMIAVAKNGGYRPEVVETDRAPVPPNNRYAQAIKAGPYVFTAGQLATDFMTAPAAAAATDPRFPHFGRSITLQTAYILDNIGAVLEAAGSSLENIVKALIYLTDSRDFPGLEEVWREYFPKDPPARAIVPATTVMPGCRLEIQVVAVAPDGHVKKETVRTDRASVPTIHQPQATKAGDLIFLSGLMATDFRSPLAPAARVNPSFPNHGSSIKRQMEYIFDTADTILQEAGSSLSQLVRRHNYLTDFAGEMPAFREVTRDRLQGVPNASTTIEVASELIIPACTVLIDAMGVA